MATRAAALCRAFAAALLTAALAGADGGACTAPDCGSDDAQSLLQASVRGHAADAQRGRAPHDYEEPMMSEAMVRLWKKFKGSRPGTAKEKTKVNGTWVAAGCLLPDEGNPQKVFWGYECSMNNADLPLTYANGLTDPPRYETAQKGEIIAMGCDDVYCPAPVVADCYYSPGICEDSTEFCWHQEHEKWGPWGVTSYGGYSSTNLSQQGPRHRLGWTQPDYCSEWKDTMKRVEAYGNSNSISASHVEQSAGRICPGAADTPPGTWRPIQAQCVKYRQEWQSCIEEALSYPNSNLNPTYNVRKSDGMPFERPLVCHPDLICTGAAYYVMPSTCVKKRPKDTCFYGSWWDSTECPRSMANKDGWTLEGGLNWNLTLDALLSAILTYPAEVASPAHCLYWDRGSARGRDAEATRQQLFQIVGLLWPTGTLPPPPSLDELMKLVKSDPFDCPGIRTGAQCQNASEELVEEPNCVQAALLRGHRLQYMPNKLWSVAHFFLHNMVDPVPSKVANAAQALAAFLGERFTCNDCRGFFQIGVIGATGIPPLSTKGDDIAKWFWYGHNIASEHVATTRGTHPWLMQLGDQNTISTPDGKPPGTLQNPWFMPWETAVEQWKANWTLETVENSACSGGLVKHSKHGLQTGECFDMCLKEASCAAFNYHNRSGRVRCEFITGAYYMQGKLGTTCYRLKRGA